MIWMLCGRTLCATRLIETELPAPETQLAPLFPIRSHGRMTNRTPVSIADLRLDLLIRLTVVKTFWFKALWSPSAGGKDKIREDLVQHLTKGWDDYEITRPEVNMRPPWDKPPSKG